MRTAALSLDEIQHQPGITPLEPCEVTEGRRRNIVVYVMRILTVSDIRRVRAKSKFVLLGSLGIRDMDGELPVKPDVQGKVQRKPLGIGRADVVLENIDV